MKDFFNFPEGIELYDIVVATPGTDALKIQILPDPKGIVGYDTDKDPLEHPEPRIIQIRAMHGPWGWDEELRVLVVFGEAPLPSFEVTWISDDQIQNEVAIGEGILRKERSEFYQRPDWLDDLRHGTD